MNIPTCDGIRSQFSELGFELPDSVLDKGVEICIAHNLDEETFAETWMAYSITHLNGDAPTLETLAQMERKELGQDSRQAHTPLTVYNKTPTTRKTPSRDQWSNHDTTPKSSKSGGVLANLAAQSNFSPASFSPLSTPSGKYSGRSNAGEVVSELSERVVGDWTARDRLPLTVAPYRDEMLTAKSRIMMEPLLEKSDILNDVIERIGSFLVEVNDLQEPTSNHQVSPTEVVCVGRVCCDSNEHLNPSSVLIEGSRQLCQGRTVPLDLSKVAQFSLFPGQIIAVVAVNPSGKRLLVSKLYHSAPLPLPPQPPRLTESLQIVVAAGPLTLSDSLQYEPLDDLLQYVMTHKPHLLVLTGPVVDVRQGQVAHGSFSETYDQWYERIVVQKVANKLKGSWTQVVVVASPQEALCLPVYPTPPPMGLPPSPPGLHLVSDPCLLSVNGLVIGVTATDSLMHLGKEEISNPLGASDRLGRLASHLLQQQSFYPLSPPCEELTVDAELWDCHASLPVTPHILIVPSHFRCFVKQLHGCVVVNPEHLVRGESGGSFARIEVAPPSDGLWSPSSHITAQVLKI